MKLLGIELKTINTAIQLQRGIQAIKGKDVVFTFERIPVPNHTAIKDIRTCLLDIKEIIQQTDEDMALLAEGKPVEKRSPRGKPILSILTPTDSEVKRAKLPTPVLPSSLKQTFNPPNNMPQ
eukprot:TRINITY_DN24214_c0_g1_i1.p2 TRINITY_DN24214_c0_g1~~TRINITY_DN24214_c0_g1_i1.p2  ORF type:complete len:122 (+),score=27.99 TRINITY_DN24214_c0_g1_i1:2-367(+)